MDGEHSDILRANAAAVADWVDATEGSELKAKVLASVADLQKGLLERDTEVGDLAERVLSHTVGHGKQSIRLYALWHACFKHVWTCTIQAHLLGHWTG